MLVLKGCTFLAVPRGFLGFTTNFTVYYTVATSLIFLFRVGSSMTIYYDTLAKTKLDYSESSNLTP